MKQNVATAERLPLILAWLGNETADTFMVSGSVPLLRPAVAALQMTFGDGTRVKGTACADGHGCNLIVQLPSAALASDILRTCHDLVPERCTVLLVPESRIMREIHCCFPFMLDSFVHFHVDALGATRVAVPAALRQR